MSESVEVKVGSSLQEGELLRLYVRNRGDIGIDRIGLKDKQIG